MKKNTVTDNEKLLVKRINGGDQEAFTMLVKQYTNRMYYYAWQYLGDRQVAEDIVQDVFTDLWIKRKSWKPTETINGYLLKSVKNRCLRYFEKQRPTPSSNFNIRDKDSAEDITNVLADIQSVDRIENSVLEKEISDALKSLPERCGLIFRMHRFEGASQKEIAKELNISLKTVGNQIHRAVEILHKKLKHHFDEE